MKTQNDSQETYNDVQSVEDEGWVCKGARWKMQNASFGVEMQRIKDAS